MLSVALRLSVHNPDLEEIEEVVARELEPATLETTIKLELGPGFLSLVKLLCN